MKIGMQLTALLYMKNLMTMSTNVVSSSKLEISRKVICVARTGCVAFELRYEDKAVT